MKHRPFRGLGAILFKEFIVVWRDPLTLFFMFFPPLVEMIAFGYALDTDVKHMAMVILNEDRTVESRQLIDRFVNTETFRVVGEVQSIEEMSSQIRKGNAYAGLQIPPKFTENFRAGHPAQVQLLIDGSNSTTALQALNTGLSVALTQSIESLLRETGRHDVPIDIRPQMLYNPAMKSPNFYVPGVIGIVLQIGTVFATAMAVVREREKGTLETLLVSPLSSLGPDAGQTCALSLHRHDDGDVSFLHHAFSLPRADCRQRICDAVRNADLRFRLAQSRSAGRHQSREPNAGTANIDDFHAPERFLLRLCFSARNDAVDFLRAGSDSSDHVFHFPDARDHSPRRQLSRILAAPAGPHHHVDRAVRFLRGALPQKDWVRQD